MDAKFENLEKMMLIWNSSDAAEIERLTKEALEHNAHFVDPTHNIIGHDAFIAMVHRTHKRIPGATYSHASEIDMQNNFCRYHWKIDLDGKRLMDGFDVTEINDAGRVVKVMGFFGLLERND